MIFIILWTAIFAFLAIYLLRSPKVRSWLVLLLQAKRLRRVTICTIALITAIIVAYKLHPSPMESSTNVRRTFMSYSAQAIQKLDTMGRITLDSLCDLGKPMPEIAYVMPLILNTYVEIVEKPTKPVLVRLDDTLQIELRGYKQFKNRGIRLTRQLQRKLGSRYEISIFSNDKIHTLQITYSGTPWDKEQLMALPVTEAALKYNLDPALLMSLIRHVSNFDFDFKGPMDTHGLLAMGGHSKESHNDNHQTESERKELEGLNQVFLGAERLSKQLQVLSEENAVATFYPEKGVESSKENWTTSPLIKSWVDQVLADVEFYHNNGLTPLE